MKSTLVFLSIIFMGINSFAQFGESQIIGSSIMQPYDVITADLDEDGDMDVLSGSATGFELVWFENEGSGVFSAEIEIASTAWAVLSIDVADMDNDGDIDVLSASKEDDKIAWYENDGNGNFGLEQIINIPDIDGNPMNDTDGNADWAQHVLTADLDGDGDLDVLSASSKDNKIAWYENEGLGSFGNQEIITDSAFWVMSFDASDLDGDGDIDILSADLEGDKIAWYENDGLGNFGDQIVISIIESTWEICASDLDGDGDNDIVVAASAENSSVSWYENDGEGVFDYQMTLINYDDGHPSIHVSDLDNDGDNDIISTSNTEIVLWFENLGNGSFGIQQVVSDLIDNYSSITSGDLDNDGDKDVLSTSGDANSVFWYENKINEGCTDLAACNYSSLNTIDDGSCCYGICACSDSFASNYSSDVECDDGSCEYSLSGYVFFDENWNGILDNGEYGLAAQEVLLQPYGIVAFTDDFGNFIFSGVNSGVFEISISPNESFPISTSNNPISFNVQIGGASEDLFFGLRDENPEFDLNVNLYAWAPYPCNSFEGHDVFFMNTGNEVMDGIIEVEFDPLFQDYQELNEIDSVVGNRIFMSFEDLYPSQMLSYSVYLKTPMPEFMGEWLESTARVYGYSNNEQVAYGDFDFIQELTCSYDPNDKQVFPIGYEEPHYVLNDTDLEYLVRFQNTGNAPAVNVTVSDTIDENLDLSTFQLLAHSHSVMTTINPENRVVDFIFENIMLPDSTVDEPGSHGLFSYTIRPNENLPAETEINNTAYIYFDNNPAIVTNTTWSTIYTCTDDLANIGYTENVVCMGDGLSFENTNNFIENYNWFYNGELVDEMSSLNLDFDEIGEFVLGLTVSNPLCEAQDSILITVNPIPNATFTEDGIELTASSGESYQWFLNGIEIQAAINQNYTITADGYYSVEVFNEFDCSTLSEEVFVVYTGVPELEFKPFVLFPNPMTKEAQIIFNQECHDCQIRITSSNGQLVREYNSVSGQALNIERKGLAAGVYIIQIEDDNHKLYDATLVVE